MDQPARTARYEGPIINNDVWDRFALRADDIVVITPPKCGTTWTQILVTSILAGRALSSAEADEQSWWLDAGFRDREAAARRFEEKRDRRCIKTHTPLDGINFDPRVTYLAVYRHPIDALFSMQKHQANMTIDMMAGRFSEDSHAMFRLFLEDELWNGACDGMDLHSIVHHFASVYRWRHLPNIHLLHYADLKSDTEAQIERIAAAMGVKIDPATVRSIVEGTSFGEIKRKSKAAAAAATEPDPFWRDPSEFFDSGTSQKWVGKLDSDDLVAFDARMAELLPDPEARRWLLWGRAGRA